MQLYHHIIHLDLRRNYYKMTVSEKIKIIENKIELSKVQYCLDRQTTKIFALSSGGVGKHEFLTDEDVLPEKGILGKAGTIKKIEQSASHTELKKQTSIFVKKGIKVLMILKK